jgi:DeoD family purine-nucleoside phosphorylase
VIENGLLEPAHIVGAVSGSAAPPPLHLKPAAPLAPRVLLPGDPHRALAVAQDVMEAPRMFNHHRGLWGYTGTAADGLPLTVQATGMGGPSTAIVVEELIRLGARTLIRIGTCGALDPALELGGLVVSSAAVADDGASRSLGAGGIVHADGPLTAALGGAAGIRPTTTATSDLFYDERPDTIGGWRAAGAVAVEMEAATLFALGARRGARTACVLGVTDLLADGAPRRLDREEIDALGLRLGQVGYAALAAADPAPPSGREAREPGPT